MLIELRETKQKYEARPGTMLPPLEDRPGCCAAGKAGTTTGAGT